MFVKRKTVRNLICFCLQYVKSKYSVQFLQQDFDLHWNILIDVMEYLGEDGSVVNAKNVGKNITALAMNIHVNSYMENIKIEQYKQYKHLTTFQKKL